MISSSLTVKHPWCGDSIPSQHLTPRCFMSSPIVCRRKTCLNSEREREIQSRKFPLFRNPGKINYKDNPAIMVFSFCSTTIIILALHCCGVLCLLCCFSSQRSVHLVPSVLQQLGVQGWEVYLIWRLRDIKLINIELFSVVIARPGGTWGSWGAGAPPTSPAGARGSAPRCSAGTAAR